MGSLHSVSMSKPHDDCWISEPCAIGKPEECPKEIAARKRDKGIPWHALELRTEIGGVRHYLDGKPIHCGMGIELQHLEHKFDDYGEYTKALQVGTVVRYERSGVGDEIRAITLHANVGGHEFVAKLEAWMRFRWPKAERR